MRLDKGGRHAKGPQTDNFSGYGRHLPIRRTRPGTFSKNGIKSFWSFTRSRLAEFNGVSANFEFHLNRCE
jgi:hypothetical protein